MDFLFVVNFVYLNGYKSLLSYYYYVQIIPVYISNRFRFPINGWHNCAFGYEMATKLYDNPMEVKKLPVPFNRSLSHGQYFLSVFDDYNSLLAFQGRGKAGVCAKFLFLYFVICFNNWC